MPDIRIAHIDLTAFFVSVELLRDPSLVGKPIMVAGPADKRGVVTCASYEVRKYGVRAGMATAIAQKKCPIAIRVDGHRDWYEEYSYRVRKYLKQFAPLFEAASIDEFYIDWTGCEKLFRSPVIDVARKIQKEILQSIGLPCAIGIGSNKIIAKIVCDQAKPDGVREIAAGAERRFLKPLDVAVLPGVGKVMKENLYARNIRTCGQLADLDENFVQERLGAWGLHVQAYARGEGSQSVGEDHEQKQISSEETFAQDTDDIKFLHTILHRMALDVAEQMRQRNLKSQCIHLKLRYFDWVTYTRQVTVLPTHDPVAIYRAAIRLLEKGDTRKKPIRLIGLGVSKFGESEGDTLDLLAQDDEKRESMLKAVDTINRKYDNAVIQIGCGPS